MRIAISGKSGCGNTTVSKLVADALGFPQINFTFRQLANERGLTFEEMCAQAEKDFAIDKEVDTRQVAMAMSEKNCVLASRLAIWMLGGADLKVFLDATPEVRGARIKKREGGNLEATIKATKERDAHDTARYKEIYGIDNNAFAQIAHMVIDANTMSAEEIAERIVERAKEIMNK